MPEAQESITAEKEMEAHKNIEFQSFKNVMDSLDALVYVADMNTYKLIFINEYGKKLFGNVEGCLCWQSLQSTQSGPCVFCTNDRLLLESGEPAEV